MPGIPPLRRNTFGSGRTGNIERARQLGRTLATELFGSDEVLNLGYDRSESPLVLAQRRILFSFVAGGPLTSSPPIPSWRTRRSAYFTM